MTADRDAINAARRAKYVEKRRQRQKRWRQKFQNIGATGSKEAMTNSPCISCVLLRDCRYMVVVRKEDPYCFVSSPRRWLFVKLCGDLVDGRSSA